MENTHAVLLAGGLGQRLWPKARREKPKQFLAFGEEKSLLQRTAQRIHPIFPWSRIWVVAKPEHKHLVKEQLPELPEENLIIEPIPKGTAAAVIMSAIIIESRFPGSIMTVLPTDHMIKNESLFRRTLSAAMSWAASHSDLVTIGIKPTRPETAYGYITLGKLQGKIDEFSCYKVLSFHEKPCKNVAQSYLEKGNSLWNSGIFTWACKSLISTCKILKKLGFNAEIKEAAQTIDKYYHKLPDDSIDYEVLEQAKNLVVFPADFGWHDLGIWETFYELSPKDQNKNSITGNVVAKYSKGCLLSCSKDKVVAVLGLKNMAVIVEDDCVLVCPRDRLQEVRYLVEELEQKGLKKFT